MSRKVYFLKGLPGSGKSYKSKQIISSDANAIRVNKDSIREMLLNGAKEHLSSGKNLIEVVFDEAHLYKMNFCSDLFVANNMHYCEKEKDFLISRFQNKNLIDKIYSSKERVDEGLVLAIEDACISFACLYDRNIIVDDTNLHPKHLRRVQNKCRNYVIDIFDMHKDGNVSLETCLEQNRNRDRKVPEFVIFNMMNQYGVFGSDSKNQKYITSNRIAIFDIDGTLADISHRVHLVRDNSKKPNWGKFFALMDKDSVREEIKSMIDNDYKDKDIVIVTGRPETYRDVTEKWLKDNNIRHNIVLMRKAKDMRSDTIVKQEILDSYIDKSLVDVVVDDRRSVIEMWVSNKLHVINVGGDDNDF